MLWIEDFRRSKVTSSWICFLQTCSFSHHKMSTDWLVRITFGLLWCFYQPFGLSFWWHPFTAEDPLVSKWCNATFMFWWISWYPENYIFYMNYCFNVIISKKKNSDIIFDFWSWMFLLRTSFQLWKFTEFECRWQCDTEVSSLCSYSYVSAFRSTFLCHTCCIAPTVLIIFMHWSLYTSWRASDWRTTPIIIPIQVSAFLALFDSMFFLNLVLNSN